VHELKAWPPSYLHIAEGRKTFDYRRDDRDFQEGDTVVLLEWDPKVPAYTGRHCRKQICHITRGGQYGIPEGFCILGLTRKGEKGA
jgi:hypothetical protein